MSTINIVNTSIKAADANNATTDANNATTDANNATTDAAIAISKNAVSDKPFMDFKQTKLTKEEWEQTEIPINPEDKKIVELIKEGYHNVNITKNNTLSLMRYLKIYNEKGDKSQNNNNNNLMNQYIFIQYLQPIFIDIVKKYKDKTNILYEPVETPKQKMKKADIIRFENTNKQFNQQKDALYECILLDIVDKLYSEYSEKRKKWLVYYYTLIVVMKYKIIDVNTICIQKIEKLLENLSVKVNILDLIEMGQEMIEKNTYLLKYADKSLYDHQKQLFNACKSTNPKLVLYIAPTGTGKTLSPIGLSEKHRVIFVCAARHVGLALAKSAISVNKKIAFAFGCCDATQIRLHYFAAKDYVKNRKSGGIFKVDNSVGDNVEIIITDLKSYIPAMYYMLSFNKAENIITYWDEPTISLDYKQHEIHSIIHENWSKNLIPNMVLSSATLPQEDEIQKTLSDFRCRFNNASIISINSYDCKKTIPVINNGGYVEMPHYLFKDYDLIIKSVKHCEKNKTLYRYIDLGEAIRFILYINRAPANLLDTYCKSRYLITNYFQSHESVNMNNIKSYYITLLGNINKECWGKISDDMFRSRKKRYMSTINIVTTDACTLTDGPSIFLADDVNKIAQFCIQSCNIPSIVLNDISRAIAYNKTINEKIVSLQKAIEDIQIKNGGKTEDDEKSNKYNTRETRRITENIQELKTLIKVVSLNSMFVPNTKEHMTRYIGGVKTNSNSFIPTISESVIEQLMLIDDIEDSWKLLLMIGIGVFASHKSTRYTEIMKELAQSQHLYLIIASSDYIYGTNYQFCHGYISKDLGYISQEKCIQAMGRVGRTNVQYDYSIRFRDDELIRKLFLEETDKQEVINMNLLFSSGSDT